MSFVQRYIRVTFRLGLGPQGPRTFAESGANTVTLPLLRTTAHVSKAGGVAMHTLDMAIYGMSQSLMNQLTTLGMVPNLWRQNYVTVQAGDPDSGFATVFIGTVNNAWADYEQMPNVAFRLSAQSGLIEALAPATPISVNGTADVATLMSGIAVQMNLAFENNGVTAKISSPYLPRSLREQAQALADAAGIEWTIDDGVLAIWNPGQARGGAVPVISANAGMVGYPTFTSRGLMLKTIFNPSIGFGRNIQVESQLQPATGTWTVYSLDHVLEARMPNGQWFSRVGAAPAGLGVPLAP